MHGFMLQPYARGGGTGNFDMTSFFFLQSPILPNAVYFNHVCYVSVTDATLCNTC